MPTPIIPRDLPAFLPGNKTGIIAFEPTGLPVHWRVASGPQFIPDGRIGTVYPQHVAELASQDHGETLARVHRFHRDGHALKLRADGISWREVCALRKCVEVTELGKTLGVADLEQPNYGLIGAMSLRLMVLDTEGQLGLPLRSKSMSTYSNQWSIGLLEGIRLADVENDPLENVAVRVLQEELGVQGAPKDKLSILGLMVDSQLYQWYFLGVMDFRGLGPEFSEAALIEKHRSAPDRWEASHLAFITPDETGLDLLERVSHRHAYPCARDELQLLHAYLNASAPSSAQ